MGVSICVQTELLLHVKKNYSSDNISYNNSNANRYSSSYLQMPSTLVS